MRPHRSIACVAAAAAGVVLLQAPATGQPAQRLDRSIDVTVQYSVRLPMKSREIDEQRSVMEQGRKLLYQLAAGECTLLLAAFGSTCELARLNVHTVPGQPRSGDDTMTVSGSAQFKVGPK